MVLEARSLARPEDSGVVDLLLLTEAWDAELVLTGKLDRVRVDTARLDRTIEMLDVARLDPLLATVVRPLLDETSEVDRVPPDNEPD